MTPPPRVAVRPATQQDVPEILAMIRELAEYEREPDAVLATEDDLREALFAEHPAAFAHIATVVSEDGEETAAAFALWFLTFSTWVGKHGIWLEDLYVRPSQRGLGLGRRLLQELARTCVERGYRRLEWTVLKWNEPALGFYRRLRAQPLTEWRTHRLHGEALRTLAGTSSGG